MKLIKSVIIMYGDPKFMVGENDWTTPYVIAKEYYNNINVQHKNLYLIPNAGHMTMIDTPQLFFEALLEINNKN